MRDWRGGKLLRPKSDVGGGGDAGGVASDPAAAAPASAPGAAAGAASGVAAAAAAALSGQELDPAGAARALRLLFERVCGLVQRSTRKGDKNDEHGHVTRKTMATGYCS